MRRLPVAGAGWLVIAAAAVPILVKSAKPIAEKIGHAMEKYGKKLQEAAYEEQANKFKTAERPEEPTEPNQQEAPESEPASASPPSSEPTKPTAHRVRQARPTTTKPKPKKVAAKRAPTTKKSIKSDPPGE
jgi:hypothetical protein